MLAELSALIKTTGTINVNNGKIILKLNIENAGIARKIFVLLKKFFGISVELMVKKNYHFNKHNTYTLCITEDMGLKDILISTKILKDKDYYSFNYGIDESIVNDKCCKRAYLRGAFLGCASISNPGKTYHLEFVTDNEQFALDLEKLINEYNLNSKISHRKNYYIIYLKEGEHIIDLLNIIGAHSSLLELENVRAYKEMRNNVNRVVNCETANLRKTADASMRQIVNIELIERTIGMKNLPKHLREIAELRLEYKEANLKELGEMLVAPVSKSGVNHRLKKLDIIAENLKGREPQND
jgi:DNA-binding protein WhiA